MKLTRLSTLSAAIMLASTAQADFFEDAAIDLELRNAYKQITLDNGADKDSSSQWAQAIRTELSSGYFHNLIGVDVGAYYAVKLLASNGSSLGNHWRDSSDPGLLPYDNQGDGHSFGKNTYEVKVNLMDAGVLKYGRMMLDMPLLNDDDSYSLPSLTEAFYADFSYESLDVHAAWAKKGNDVTNAGFTDYEVEDGSGGTKSEAVKTLGASYDFGNGLEISADYAVQQEYAKRYLANIAYSMDLDADVGFDFEAQYGRNKLMGYKKDNAAGNDTSQKTYGLKVVTYVAKASIGLTYTKVSQTTLGEFDAGWGGGDDNTEYFGYNSVQISDFNGNGQKALGLTLGYDFAGVIDGLSASAIYVKGKIDPEGGNKLDEKEYNLRIDYHLPQVKGLAASLQYGKNTREQDAANDGVTTDTRLIVKYNVAVF